jgi:phosphatidate cytidylyltransferase
MGLAPFIPALARSFPAAFLVALVPLVAAGAVWGDLLESAIKREVGVKDAASWLPGFGGILDRIDSLLITVALAYWALRILEPG